MKTTFIPFTIIPAFAALSLLVPAGCDDGAPVVDEEEQLVADDAEAELALAEEEAAEDEDLLPEESLDVSLGEAEPLAAYTNRALTMGTATFSQTSSYDLNIDKAIDGDAWGSTSGWAIYDTAQSPDLTLSEHASFELVDANSGDTPSGSTRVRFVLRFGHGDQHHLGSFFLYVTNSAKSTFADGVNSGGDAIGTATWTKVDVTSVTESAATGTAPDIRADSNDYIYAYNCGSGADDVTYTVIGTVPIDRITGVRLYAWDNNNLTSLSGGGPGCQANGNFHMTDFRFHTEPI